MDAPLNTDRLMEKMFLVRRVGLLSLLGAVIALVAAFFPEALAIVSGLLAVVFFVTIPVTSYYVYQIGKQNSGVKYAAAHAALCMILTFLGCLVSGILFIPLLVRNDIERLREPKDMISGP